MQRELKFRFWNKIDKEFLFTEVKTPLDIHKLSPWKIGNMPDECIVTQYTALKDSEGKEIYEGDILSIPSVASDCEVIFDSGMFGILREDKKCIIPLGTICTNYKLELTIIGNIFENKDLLC